MRSILVPMFSLLKPKPNIHIIHLSPEKRDRLLETGCQAVDLILWKILGSNPRLRITSFFAHFLVEVVRTLCCSLFVSPLGRTSCLHLYF